MQILSTYKENSTYLNVGNYTEVSVPIASV